MSKGILITATGTDAGKTYVTGLIVKKLREAGYDATYYKAALSGAERKGDSLIPGDADYVNRIAGIGEEMKSLVSYVYEEAVSPHLAAQLEGNPVELSRIKQDYEKAQKKHEYVTVEGSGGIVCPIRYDEKEKIFLEDIIKELGLETILIADAGLGTINSVILTTEYMKNRKIGVQGIILNHYHGTIMEKDNVKMIEKMTNIPVIARVSDGDTELKIEAEKLADLYA